MIVKMKEILLFTSARTVDETILELGKLGAVEIREVNGSKNGTTEIRKLSLERVENVIRILKDHPKQISDKGDNNKIFTRDPKQVVDRVLQAEEIKQKCREKLDNLYREGEWYHTWGKDIDIIDFDYLKRKDLFLRLYLLDITTANSARQKFLTHTMPEQNGVVPLVLIGRNESEKLDHEEETLPKLSFENLGYQIERRESQLLRAENYVEDQTEILSFLESYKDQLSDQLTMQQTLEGMGDIEGRLKYLKGYLPTINLRDFTAVAEANNWGYHISEPEKSEDVPVYIKNPKWISIINPVMKFIDIVPGYKEIDVSIYFLVAFALFFAMLVGDAGYGIVLLLVTFFLRKKLTPQLRVLIFVLSGATIIWGVLSGTYFGSEKIAAIPVLNDLIVPEIASFGVDNISFMMHLSFLIGTIHLTIAHGIRVIRFINSIRSLSEIGWIALVWGLFFVSEQLVLGKPIPSWGNWLFVVGASLVALFSMESKSFLKSIGVSLANLPLSLISGFSDIVSYVRLFAVGMATAAVAASFNNMIIPEDTEGLGILKLVMMAFALLLGHGLNIVLALMAVMVHGIRLNMLEFAGHLGVQFSGEAFKPFKLNSPDNSFKSNN